MLLMIVIVNADGGCRRQVEQALREGRTCRKACVRDTDCHGRKQCICDGFCGKSCFNPGLILLLKFLTVPHIFHNASAICMSA